MAVPLTSNVTVCSICGEPLNPKGDCVACLLRTGLDRSAVETEPAASLVFGDFEIARREDGSLWELGHGGMAATYLAVDKVLRRKVALKVIEVPKAARTSQAMRERFLREARAAAALRHPNVAAVFQFGASPDGSQCYYAMELIEGETLEARVRRDGPLAAKLVLEIATQVTRALMAAAAHGLIHRDLKPGNIMLTQGDADAAELEVKVIDFGLAKAIADAGGEMDLTHGEFVGTPNFASPEQFGRGPVDARSDIYSLGATLWFALTGKTPFAGRNIDEIQRAQQSDALPIEQLTAAHVRSHLRSLLKSMLAFEPAARPGIHDLAERLRRCSAQASDARRARVALAAALILIVGVSAGVYFSRERIVSAAKGPGARVMLAVLPFENLSGDPDQELFSDGLTDEMISQLGRLQPERLGVIARTSTVQYKRTKKSIPEIGRELGVNYVLDGTVRRVGSEVRVSAELIQVSDQRHLFDKSYERDSPDIAALQQEITQAVSNEVGSKLNVTYQTSPVSAQRTNPEAYEAYVRGCRYFDDSEFNKSIDYFNQAIKLDPSYGPSYAKLAVAYYELAFLNMLPPNVAFERTRNAALHALEKDNTLSEAHGALAEVKLHYDLDFPGAEGEFKRALELDPNNAAVRHDYSHYLIAMGRTDDSAIETAKAVALDPVSIDLIGCLCWHHYAARHYDDSITWAKKAIQMAPDVDWSHLVLGWAYEQQARFEEAIAEFQKAVKLSKDSEYAIAALGHAYAVAGKKEELGTILEKLKGISAQGYVSAFDMAVIYTGLGDKEQAFRWLEKAYEERSSFLVYSLWEPRLDPLRSAPRFQELLHRIGFSPSNSAMPEKSIAVLPFENLSRDPDNAFFADGVQDELLTDLAKIADLKVISRTSVMQYKSGIARNLKEIAQQLGVSNVVEGSVRRSGNHVRVSVQLIDAVTDRHIWAQNYDRTLADSLALEGELATEIAAGVGATLSPQEKARVEATPTKNTAAYDAYLRGRALAAGLTTDFSNNENAARSFQDAVTLDPGFALAWAYLSCAQSSVYWTGIDSTPARLAAAKDAVDHAVALDPSLPETHLALGYYRYYGARDFSGALAEFQLAEKSLPNDVGVLRAIGLIQRRFGHWDEAIAVQRRVFELDPRNTDASITLAITYKCLRRFPEALATVDRVLAFEPTNTGALWQKAGVFWATGDLKAVELLLANPGIDPLMRGVQALFQRRYAAATEILSKALADKPYEQRKWVLFGLGLSELRAGNVAAARATYQKATQELQHELKKVTLDSFQEAELRADLGRAYAGLGDAASAIAEGQKAMAMDPSSKDPLDGPEEEEAMAQIYALLGNADGAIPILKRLLQIPSGAAITPALMRLDPIWDQIRNDARFQELAAEKTL